MTVTQSIVRDICVPVVRGIADKGAGGLLVPPPVGFDWVPPVKVFRSPDGTYSTDYDASSFMPATTADLWVATTGNDTTGDGTQLKPYISISKAMTIADSLPDDGVHIKIVSGFYTLDNRWIGSPNKSLVVTSDGGSVTISTHKNVVWAIQVSGAYKATRNSVGSVYDTTNIDSNGNPVQLVSIGSEASCAATPNSFYTDGTSVWVHTFDGRIPTNTSIKVLLNVTGATYNSVNKSWYIKGITFEGGNPFIASSSSGHAATITFDECVFRFCSPTALAGSFNGFIANGISNSVMNNCSAYGNPNDGLNYKGSSGNGISTKSVEINCRGYVNGISGSNICNGSTAHDNCRVVRVNGIYFGCNGPQIADVGTVESWNLGCNSHDADATGISDSCYYAGNTAAIWLDSCIGSGSSYATVADDTSKIRTRNCTLTGLSYGDVASY